MVGFIFMLFKHTLYVHISVKLNPHSFTDESTLERIPIFADTLWKNGIIDTLFILLNGLLWAKQINGSGDDKNRDDEL